MELQHTEGPAVNRRIAIEDILEDIGPELERVEVLQMCLLRRQFFRICKYWIEVND
jgi:hypothetical protein